MDLLNSKIAKLELERDAARAQTVQAVPDKPDELEQAEELFREALAGFVKIYKSETHDYALEAISSLSQVLIEQGRLDLCCCTRRS